MSRLVIIGCGGHGKVVIQAARAAGYVPIGVFDDNPILWNTDFFGLPVIGPIANITEPDTLAVVALGDNQNRRRISETVPCRWASVIHPNATVDPSATIGEGAMILAGCVVQANAKIGAHVIMNTASTVDHDSTVGSFCHLCPGVHLAGDVHLDDGVMMGIGSSCIPGTHVGGWSTIGAGAVVIRDLPSCVVAAGVPAEVVSSARGVRSKAPNKTRFVIVGAGGFGREVLMIFRSLGEEHSTVQRYKFGGFLDDGVEYRDQLLASINAELLGTADRLSDADAYVIAIASPATKRRIAEQISVTKSAKPIVLVHSNAWMGDDVELGEGTIVAAGCSLTTRIRIGRHVHLNMGCTIGHDARIDDYVTLSPGVHVSGDVHIAEDVLVGTGAVLLPGVSIGKGVAISAGAVVTKDVPPNKIAFGNPAKCLPGTAG
ncbi:acetyltransferase [Planctomycetota bacterium]